MSGAEPSEREWVVSGRENDSQQTEVRHDSPAQRDDRRRTDEQVTQSAAAGHDDRAAQLHRRPAPQPFDRRGSQEGKLDGERPGDAETDGDRVERTRRGAGRREDGDESTERTAGQQRVPAKVGHGEVTTRSNRRP